MLGQLKKVPKTGLEFNSSSEFGWVFDQITRLLEQKNKELNENWEIIENNNLNGQRQAKLNGQRQTKFSMRITQSNWSSAWKTTDKRRKKLTNKKKMNICLSINFSLQVDLNHSPNGWLNQEWKSSNEFHVHVNWSWWRMKDHQELHSRRTVRLAHHRMKWMKGSFFSYKKFNKNQIINNIKWNIIIIKIKLWIITPTTTLSLKLLIVKMNWKK